jgi:competence protein ComEC
VKGTPDARLLFPASGIWVGCASAQLFYGIPATILLIATFAIAVIFLVKRKSYFLQLFCLALFIGGVITGIHEEALHRDLFLSFKGSSISVVGVVTTDPQLSKSKIRGDFRAPQSATFYLRTKEVNREAIRVPILVSTTNHVNKLIPGTKIVFYGKVSDYRLNNASAFIFAKSDLRIISQPNRISKLTFQMRSALRDCMQGLPAAAMGLIPGIVIGDRTFQSVELTANMRATGLTHLTAVSGANLAIVAALVLALCRRVGVKGRTLWLIVALALSFFILLVRPSPSVLRAAVMTTVALTARATGNRSAALPSLGVAIGLLLIFNPFLATDPGFALSVSATAGLLLLAPKIENYLMRYLPKRLNLLAETLAIPISATIFSLPIVVAISGQLSLVSVFANLIVAPVIAPITIVGFFMSLISIPLPQISHLLGILIAPFAMWIAGVANFCADLPFAALRWSKGWMGVVSLVLLAIALRIILLALRNYSYLKFPMILILLLFMIFSTTRFGWPPKDWIMATCDVGQGDGVVLSLGANSAVVIDVGPDPTLIDSCLHELKVKNVELLILTHFHADHVEGLPGLLKGRKVNQVWLTTEPTPADEFLRVQQWLGNIPSTQIYRGARFKSQFVSLEVVWPDQKPILESPANNASIAIVGSIHGHSFFSAGDLELAGQEIVLNRLTGGVEILKVTHHGSKLQNQKLVQTLSPKLCLISVGADNPYGHPAPVTLDLLGHNCGATARTDRSGTLTVVGNPLRVVSTRKSIWR